MPFCRKLTKLIEAYLRGHSRPSASPKHTSLISDILDLADLNLSETKALAAWSENDVTEERCLSRVSDCLAVQTQVTPLPVYDEKCKLLMNRINACLLYTSPSPRDS